MGRRANCLPPSGPVPLSLSSTILFLWFLYVFHVNARVKRLFLLILCLQAPKEAWVFHDMSLCFVFCCLLHNVLFCSCCSTSAQNKCPHGDNKVKLIWLDIIIQGYGQWQWDICSPLSVSPILKFKLFCRPSYSVRPGSRLNQEASNDLSTNQPKWFIKELITVFMEEPSGFSNPSSLLISPLDFPVVI